MISGTFLNKGILESLGEGPDMGVSENRGSKYSTLNSRVLIIKTAK